MFEQNYDYENASKFYLKAAKSFELDKTPTTANAMLQKWCECKILMKHFDDKSMVELINSYEKIGNKYLQTPLIKTQAKDFFFKAILCYLAIQDVPGAKKTLESTSYEDPSFEGSRQYKFIESIMSAIEAKDTNLWSMSV